jgi:hypothetical protein
MFREPRRAGSRIERYAVGVPGSHGHAVCCHLAANQKSRRQRQGEKMVKIRSAECLVLVAIVASAAAMQVRERLAEPAVQRRARFDEQSACGAARGGILPARCGAGQDMHSERGTDDDPRAMSRHDSGRHVRPQGLWV